MYLITTVNWYFSVRLDDREQSETSTFEKRCKIITNILIPLTANYTTKTLLAVNFKYTSNYTVQLLKIKDALIYWSCHVGRVSLSLYNGIWVLIHVSK